MNHSLNSNQYNSSYCCYSNYKLESMKHNYGNLCLAQYANNKFHSDQWIIILFLNKSSKALLSMDTLAQLCNLLRIYI